MLSELLGRRERKEAEDRKELASLIWQLWEMKRHHRERIARSELDKDSRIAQLDSEMEGIVEGELFRTVGDLLKYAPVLQATFSMRSVINVEIGWVWW